MTPSQSSPSTHLRSSLVTLSQPVTSPPPQVAHCTIPSAQPSSTSSSLLRSTTPSNLTPAPLMAPSALPPTSSLLLVLTSPLMCQLQSVSGPTPRALPIGVRIDVPPTSWLTQCRSFSPRYWLRREVQSNPVNPIHPIQRGPTDSRPTNPSESDPNQLSPVQPTNTTQPTQPDLAQPSQPSPNSTHLISNQQPPTQSNQIKSIAA